MKPLIATIAATALLAAGCGGGDEESPPAADKPATTKAPKTPSALERVRNTLDTQAFRGKVAEFDIRNGTVVVDLTRQKLLQDELEGICLNAYTAADAQGAVVYARDGQQLYTCP